MPVVAIGYPVFPPDHGGWAEVLQLSDHTVSLSALVDNRRAFQGCAR